MPLFFVLAGNQPDYVQIASSVLPTVGGGSSVSLVSKALPMLGKHSPHVCLSECSVGLVSSLYHSSVLTDFTVPLWICSTFMKFNGELGICVGSEKKQWPLPAPLSGRKLSLQLLLCHFSSSV